MAMIFDSRDDEGFDEDEQALGEQAGAPDFARGMRYEASPLDSELPDYRLGYDDDAD